ncbi:MAG: hypothetical protein S4CHLAM37_05550 [Chlamydiia bacterium]|nr:hypothetical protein [Chlamydiia bacterium]
MKKTIVIFFLLTSIVYLPNSFCSSEKKAYIITGTESSGSMFISRVIAYVLGLSESWEGYGMLGKPGDQTVVVHRSIPYDSGSFMALNDYKKLLEDYKFYFIVCTRDMKISCLSAKRRFKRSASEVQSHHLKAKEILSEILNKEEAFIWSYETQLLLKEAYYQKLYEFLEVESDYLPPHLFDANDKYIYS